MLRKIITELAYSPALAGNLGYYIKQLRSEASKREIGLIFVILAVVVQLFASLFPPESTNTNNPAIFIDGGIESIDEYLVHYDKNTGNIRDLLDSIGIARTEIEAAKLTHSPPSTPSFVWSMQNTRYDTSYAHFFMTSNSQQSVAYLHAASLEKNATQDFYTGMSSKLGGWFAISTDGASLITEKSPPSPCETWQLSPDKPLLINSWTASYNTACQSIATLSLSVREIPASTNSLNKVKASNRIAYTVNVKNTTDSTLPVVPAINLEDVLEYSRILDYGGGEYNFDTKNLTWPAASIEAGGATERTLIVQLLPTIPATARGAHVKRSYDCEITLSFGNTLSHPVSCPPTKYMETITNSFGKLPAIANITASVVLLTISIYLYARSRQLLSELYIIRHNHLGGL